MATTYQDPQELIRQVLQGANAYEPEPENELNPLDRLRMQIPDEYSGVPDTGSPVDDRYFDYRAQTNPQDLIRQQLAGDVVPLRPGIPAEFDERMGRLNADPRQGQMGQQSIRALGGENPRRPYLDLMDILMFNRRPR
jgi:hypothetical protein